MEKYEAEWTPQCFLLRKRRCDNDQLTESHEATSRRQSFVKKSDAEELIRDARNPEEGSLPRAERRLFVTWGDPSVSKFALKQGPPNVLAPGTVSWKTIFSQGLRG